MPLPALYAAGVVANFWGISLPLSGATSMTLKQLWAASANFQAGLDSKLYPWVLGFKLTDISADFRISRWNYGAPAASATGTIAWPPVQDDTTYRHWVTATKGTEWTETLTDAMNCLFLRGNDPATPVTANLWIYMSQKLNPSQTN